MRFALVETDVESGIPSPIQGGGYWQLAGVESRGVVVTTSFDNVDYAFILKTPSFNAGSEQLLATAAQLNQVMRSNARWRKHVCSFNAPTDVDSLTETVDAVFDLVSEFGPGSVDFSQMNAAAVSGEHLAASLRALSTWQDEIMGWNDAIAVAAASLALHGEDPNDALYGLL